MGKPNFTPKFIPVDIDKDKCIKALGKISESFNIIATWIKEATRIIYI